jgi:hypothetical protein
LLGKANRKCRRSRASPVGLAWHALCWASRHRLTILNVKTLKKTTAISPVSRIQGHLVVKVDMGENRVARPTCPAKCSAASTKSSAEAIPGTPSTSRSRSGGCAAPPAPLPAIHDCPSAWRCNHLPRHPTRSNRRRSHLRRCHPPKSAAPPTGKPNLLRLPERFQAGSAHFREPPSIAPND